LCYQYIFPPKNCKEKEFDGKTTLSTGKKIKKLITRKNNSKRSRLAKNILENIWELFPFSFVFVTGL
jgi:hypothetical protein